MKVAVRHHWLTFRNVLLVWYYSLITFVRTCTFMRTCTANARCVSGACGLQYCSHGVKMVCLTLCEQYYSPLGSIYLVLVTWTLLKVQEGTHQRDSFWKYFSTKYKQYQCQIDDNLPLLSHNIRLSKLHEQSGWIPEHRWCVKLRRTLEKGIEKHAPLIAHGY